MEIRAALAGNPNCGKTTMFNALTGANQYVKLAGSYGREKRRESKNKRIKRGEDQSDGSSGSLFSFPVYA